MDDLEKIDIVRRRLNISYEKAKKALQETGGDVVEALIMLEDEKADKGMKKQEDVNRYKVKGEELINKIKDIIRKSNASKINVKDKNHNTLLEIPVSAGVVSLVLFPYMGILAGMVAMYKDYILEIEKSENTSETKVKTEVKTTTSEYSTDRDSENIEENSYSSYKYEYE